MSVIVTVTIVDVCAFPFLRSGDSLLSSKTVSEPRDWETTFTRSGTLTLVLGERVVREHPLNKK